ncbi:hypothetical protein ZWY2020_024727 [Hordeum vulgare]|nr:hypothetical protein ZWY2020_024727 [Hordeum vulgare]
MQNPNCKVMVDNCYGEFVETSEPPMVGEDLIVGSLIKNPGGTIAPCGGYVAGKKDLVAAFGSAPGHVMRAMFQGLFLAPQMVGEAVKGGLLIAEVMSAKGYRVQPLPRAPRHDIVQYLFLRPSDCATPGYRRSKELVRVQASRGGTSSRPAGGLLRTPPERRIFRAENGHHTEWHRRRKNNFPGSSPLSPLLKMNLLT